jgi:pimeloyl-ACP methyl ester carboxylesterase
MLTTVSDPCETALSPFEDRYADVSTFRTHFWRAGSAGPAVILLAGIGCSVLEWEKNIAALADRHRVYAFDMPRPRPDR